MSLSIVEPYLNTVKAFVTGKDFWQYHGLGLSFVWLFLSLFGILARKILPNSLRNVAHALIFAATDFTTIALAGGAFYRVYPHLDKFWTWDPIKQGHIALGSLFAVLVIIQHLGGVSLLLKGVQGAQGKPHRLSGMIVSSILRVVAVVGWYMVNNIQYATIAAGITLADALILMIAGKLGSGKLPKAKKN